MEISTPATGELAVRMAQGSTSGQMDACMRESGGGAVRAVVASSYGLLVQCMKENFKMDSWRGLGHTRVVRGTLIGATGCRI